MDVRRVKSHPPSPRLRRAGESRVMTAALPPDSGRDNIRLRYKRREAHFTARNQPLAAMENRKTETQGESWQNVTSDKQKGRRRIADVLNIWKFGHWVLFGIWNLVFGIYARIRARSLAYKARAVLAVFILSLVPAFLFNIDMARSEATIGVPASCGSTSMSVSVERTGTASSFLDDSSPGSTTVSIPPDAEVMVVGAAGHDSNVNYWNNGTLSITGFGNFTKGPQETTFSITMGGLWYKDVGSFAGANRTLAWSWADAGAPSDAGTYFTYAFYKGVDTSNPVGDSDSANSEGPSASTSTLTLNEGDAIVAMGGKESGSGTWTNATQITTSGVSTMAEAFPSVGTSVTHAGSNVMVAAIVLNQGTLAVGSNSCLTMDGYTFENDDATAGVDGNTQMAGSAFSGGQTLSNVRAGQRIMLRTQISNVGAGTIDSTDELGLFYDRGDGYWSQAGYAKPPVTGSGSGCASADWSCEDVIGTDDLRYSSMAIDPAGRPWIAYYNFTDGDLELAKYVGRGGTGCISARWTCTTLDSTGDVGRFTSLAIGKDGSAWLAYADITNSRLKVAEYVGTGGSCDDTSWECETVDFSGQYAAVALDSGGTPWVSYRLASSSDLKVATYVGGASGSGCSNSSDWNCTSVDSTVNGGEYTSIAINSDGSPWISYHDIGNTALKAAHFVGTGGNCDDTAWSCVTVDADDTVGHFSSIAISPSNIPWISYHDDTSNYLKVAAMTGSGGNCDDSGGSDDWSCTEVDTSTDAGGFHTTIAFAPDGLPWIAYHDTTGGDLYVARYVDSGGNCSSAAWSCTAIETSNSVGRFPSLAFAPDGMAWLSYKDATSGGIKVAYVDRGGEITISPGLSGNNGDVLAESHADMTSATDTTGRDDADCVSSTTWNDGGFFEAPLATGLSMPAGDTTSQCTEIAWAIDTSQAVPGTTYRFIVASKDAFNSHRGVWRGVAGVPASLPELTIAIDDETTYSYSKAALGMFDSDCDDAGWECSTITSTATETGNHLSLAFRPGGSPVIAHYDEGVQDAEFTEYVGSGGTGCANAAWNCDTIESTGTVGAGPSVVIGSDGSPWMSYRFSDSLSVAHYVGSGGNCEDDAAWECENVDATAGAGYGSIMRVGLGGEMFVVHGNNTAEQINLAQYVGSGGTGCTSSAWTCTLIDDSVIANANLSMTVDNEGIPWIAYVSANDLLLARYVGSGGTGCSTGAWECITIDDGVIANDGGEVSMTLDGDGDPWITYAVSSGGIWSAEYVGSGGTGCAAGVSDWDCVQIDTGVSAYPRMATDSQGDPWVAYVDNSGDLAAARYEGSGSWDITAVDTSSTVIGLFSIALAFDSGGTPWVAYGIEESGTDFEIRVARLKLPPNNLGHDAAVPYNGGVSAGSGSLSYLLDLGLSPATGELGECTAIADYTGYCGLFHPEGHLDSITAQVNERAIYGFSTSYGSDSQLPTGKVYFQTDLAPTSSNVVLQVYRHGTTNAWETIITDSTSSDCSSENCVIMGMPSGTASEYFELIDGRYLVSFRIYQQESASVSYTFSIDGFKSTQTSGQLRHGRVFRDQLTDPLTW